MHSPTLDTLRLFLHVIAAAIWVGGQVVLGGLVPALRRSFPDSTKVVARAFARLAWPAFLVAFATGMWNLFDVTIGEQTAEYQMTVGVHVVLAVVAAAAAAVHSVGRSRVALALGGAIGLVASLATVFVGLLTRTGS